jgi:hypothetical protein
MQKAVIAFYRQMNLNRPEPSRYFRPQTADRGQIVPLSERIQIKYYQIQMNELINDNNLRIIGTTAAVYLFIVVGIRIFGKKGVSATFCD